MPEETLLHVTALLPAHRREIGTRRGRRAGTVRTQAKLVLRWFRDNATSRIPAAEAGAVISTCCPRRDRDRSDRPSRTGNKHRPGSV